MACVGSLVSTTEQRSEVGLGAGILKSGVRSDKYLDRLPQKGFPILSPNDDPGSPQRYAEGSGCPEGAG